MLSPVLNDVCFSFNYLKTLGNVFSDKIHKKELAFIRYVGKFRFFLKS